MCGLAGKINFAAQVRPEEILAMTDKIVHRGPDDAGVYVDGSVGLGSRRLAILDLSEAGHMPMVSQDGETIIAYNGEFYNYKDYWGELKADGVDFRSTTDTEVILYLYKKYGFKSIDKMRGMFAFVIYDKKKQIIFGVRDRFGQKPLKYYLDDNVFIFASELKAILENKEVKKEVDYQAISDFLTYQYVPCPATGFQNIFKLPPAHFFVLDIKSKTLDIQPYWSPSYAKKQNYSIEEWCERIRDKLEESTKLRLIADVPLGAFLSGGVDSSAIVAMMAKNSSRAVKTFSIGFHEKDFDERVYARKVAQLFSTEHHEMVVEPDMIKDLPALIYYYEEPFGDPSMLPTYYLSRFAREQVTVALNGDAGDENFAGYGRYNFLDYSLHFQKIPKFIRSMGRKGIHFTINHIYSHRFLKKVAKFADSIEKDIVERYMEYICYYNEQQKQHMFTDDFRQRLKLQDSSYFLKKIFAKADGKSLLDKILYTDALSYLPDDLLVKVDIATMSQSLEGRSPMLDHTFFEFTSQIPSSLKLHGQEGKFIFKKALEGILPNDILYRRKMGFGVPAGEWFRGELKDYYLNTVINESVFIGQIMKKEYVSSLFDEHLRNGGGEGRPLWLLLCLELWYRTYFSS